MVVHISMRVMQKSILPLAPPLNFHCGEIDLVLLASGLLILRAARRSLPIAAEGLAYLCLVFITCLLLRGMGNES